MTSIDDYYKGEGYIKIVGFQEWHLKDVFAMKLVVETLFIYIIISNGFKVCDVLKLRFVRKNSVKSILKNYFQNCKKDVKLI